MSVLGSFTFPSARPLPVLLLLDVSGSMGIDGKISVLNRAVADMIGSFASEDLSRVEIQVAVITFGGTQAKVHQPLKAARDIQWQDMQANGKTPMGDAFRLATEIIEDRQLVPSRAYTPTIVLVSDGIPTDDWESQLQRLISSERASKAARFALAIGADASREMLQRFVSDPEVGVLEAQDSRNIARFFRLVTMSVTSRSHSSTPNLVTSTDLNDYDDFDY